MMKTIHTVRSAPVAASLALAALLAGCAGDDGPAAPGGGAGQDLTIDTGTLDFGAVASGSSLGQSFRITASADNTGDASGDVTLADGSNFVFVSGNGPFTLAPGEATVVTVRFQPDAAGTKFRDTVELGTGDSVALEGFGSGSPRYTFTPTGLSEGSVSTNYSGFTGDKVAVSYGTGRSHGAHEDWLSCSSVARWIFNGNGIAESKVGFTLSAPAQTSRIEVLVGLEAESGCVQFLIETDGTEHKYENLTNCQGFAQSFNMTGGGHTIAVGTDQQGFCTDDLHVRYITITCVGAVVAEADWEY
ncbi:MAG: hypothetical protein R6X35_13320 [Candidatus Krumholzibacteriia bacterium]